LATVAALATPVSAGEDREPANSADKTSNSKSRSDAAGGGVVSSPRAERRAKGSGSAGDSSASTDRVAVADQSPGTRRAFKPTAASVSGSASLPASAPTPIARAIRTIADCQVRYQAVEDYTCTFFKRERIQGRLTPVHIMALKVRTNPQSIYLKFQQPARGREAIYVSGRHGGKVLAHDVGLNKLLAGTLQLEPTGARAMEDCRHPITEAGIGPLLETLSRRWAVELDPAESVIAFRDDILLDARRCTMIESTHPLRRPEFLHHRVRVFIDQEIGLPIRFEAYDWPKHPNSEPDLQEEYTYTNLKLNVGLKEIDFETSNAAYSFGRF